MVTGVICRVNDLRESFSARISGFFHELLSFFEISIKCIVVDVWLAAVSIIHELSACRICPARSHEVSGRCVCSLHDRVGNIVAVDSKGQSLTDLSILELVKVAVEVEVVSSDDRINVELIITLKAWDLLCRNVLDEVDFTVLVCTVSSVRILDKHELDGVELDSVSIPVVRVLCYCDV